MPSSPGSDRPPAAGASRELLAEWQRGAFTKLRAHRDAATPIDDELPDDPLADLDETRSALDRLAGA